MGKFGYNSNARNQPGRKSKEVEQKSNKSTRSQGDEFSEQSVVLQDEYQTVSDANPIVLPQKSGKSEDDKRSQKLKKSKEITLSKKQKRKLKQVIDRKKKTAKRSELLASLSQFQVSEKELSLYKPMSQMGQKDTKEKSDISGEYSSQLEMQTQTREENTKGKKKGKKRKLSKQSQAAVSVLKTVKEESDDTSSSDSESEEENDLGEATNIDRDFDNVKKLDDKTVEINSQNDEVAREGKAKEKSKEVLELGEKTQSKKEQHSLIQQKESEKPTPSTKPAIYVEVKRTQEIQAARVLLPILAEEQMIMETIHENNVVIISGETGSGKTTQVPQFLYEAGFGSHSPTDGMIGITEPRRVAAVSMSKRVACEMSMSESIVSYQIRYEGNATDATRIKFMTDGVLLKEMETDFMLSKYSAIIIDEAHERSVFTDILIGLLSRVVPLRNKQAKPLKLIIMSATLRVDDFVDNKRLFVTPPPLLKVDSRQYPVTIHFNRRTPTCYVTEAYNKICKIHRTLKQGGILVFLTGQNEVHALCRKLKRTFPSNDRKKNILETEETNRKRTKRKTRKERDEFSLSTLEDDDFDGADSPIDDDSDMDDEAYDISADESIPLHVLPMYSLLSADKQAKVFEPCPVGSRLCVIATNVAETSLTIPGIKYVVDSGKVKTRCYDKITGVSSFRITWTSKASANQRAGRAGRVEPGHCYRLYSSAIFQHDFDDFAEAEICRRPADELMLLMKSMSIDKVSSFPFPSPPNSKTLKASEDLLSDLGALEKKKTKNGSFNTTITLLGRSISHLPVAPRYGKMILLAKQGDCMQYMLTIVAALTVKEIFSDDIKVVDKSTGNDEDDVAKKRMLITQARRKWAGTGETSLLGDMMVILRAVGAFEYAGCSEKFCKENGLRYKAMAEIKKLRAQLSRAVNAQSSNADVYFDPKISPPTDLQAKIIRQIMLSCLGDRVARKIPHSDIKDAKMKNAYRCCSTEDPVFIHPSSSMFKILPDYVIYQEIIETSKLYMRGITCVEESWLATFAAYKCQFSKPLDAFTPRYDGETGKVKCYMSSTFGPHSWPLQAQELDYPPSVDRTKWFARFVLEGKVFQQLEEFVPYLLTPASVMVKTWAKLQPRTEVILKELLTENVFDRLTLQKAWKENKDFLLKPYLHWIPGSLHDKVRQIWPPAR
eukprot:gene14128-15605_t